MTTIEKDVMVEALLQLQGVYEWWNRLRYATDAEKELAKMKVAVVRDLLDRVGSGKINDKNG